MQYRHDIEGLRAIAVMVVLLYHFGVPGLDGGFVGVDVFFVISGFLITSLLIHEREKNGAISIAAFYGRRARRLLPISTTVLVLSAVAGALLLPATRLPDLAEEITAAALFGANILFAERGSDYLTASLDLSPLQHFWSLAVEEQFYVLWPAMIAVVTLRSRSVRTRVAVAMAAVVSASFAASIALTGSSPSWSYFGLHTRAWELGVGALLAAGIASVERITPPVRATLGWLGLVGIAVSVVTFGDVAFPGWVAALPVLATAAVLVSGDDTRFGPRGLLRSAPLTYLGLRSYSLYLWHWPVIIIAEAHLARSLDRAEKVAAMALVFVLAEVGYRTIEHPVRSSAWLVQRRGVSLGLGGGLIALSLATGAIVGSYRPDLSTGVVAAAPSLTTTPRISTTSVPGPTPTTSTTTPDIAQPVLHNLGDTALGPVVDALSVDVAPDNLRPGLYTANGDVGRIYPDNCHVYYDTRAATDCVYGDRNGTTTVALWGDSHAAQWFPALDHIARDRGWKLLSLTQGGCPFLDITVWNRSDNAVFTHCAAWRRSVRKHLADIGVDVVFLSQHYGLMAADTRAPIPLSVWQSQLPELLAEFVADGVLPIVLADSPNPSGNVPECVVKNRRDIQTCNPRLDNPQDLTITEAIVGIATSTGAGVVDPTRWLCSNGTCPVIVGDILAYRDGQHLSNTMVEWLTPVLDAAIGEPIARRVDPAS